MNADRRDTCVHSGPMRPTNIPHIEFHVDQMLSAGANRQNLSAHTWGTKMHTETVEKEKEEII